MAKSADAASNAAPGAAVPAKAGMKKMIVIVAVIALLAAVGVGAMVYMKKSAAAAAEAEEEGEAAPVSKAAHSAKMDLNHPPVFVPLEPFVVNLADKDADRYGQIAITFQVGDAKFAEQLKAYMPAVRNSILMVLAHKTSHELLERAGKEALAEEIMREAVRPMGIEIDPPADDTEDAVDKDEGATPKKKNSAAKRKKKVKEVVNPIQHVHFSNFIIQ